MKTCKVCRFKYRSSKVRDGICKACWSRTFPIAFLTREFLKDHLEPHEIAQLDDGKMEEIADRLDPIAWQDVSLNLEYVARQSLEEK